ncbi:hypothetical protein ACP70R_020965 [Stipagrostis hirtigluma subsp. patula]
MAGKENAAAAACTATAAPRLTRAAAKRAASVTAVAVVAKRKRVALPTLPNAVLGAHDDDGGKPKKPLLPTEAKKKAAPKPKPAPSPAATAGVDDEEGDPQLCAPYASDIYSYLRSMEAQAKRRLAEDYVATVQVDVAANMRSILVDWLVEVAACRRRSPRTTGWPASPTRRRCARVSRASSSTAVQRCAAPRVPLRGRRVGAGETSTFDAGRLSVLAFILEWHIARKEQALTLAGEPRGGGGGRPRRRRR